MPYSVENGLFMVSDQFMTFFFVVNLITGFRQMPFATTFAFSIQLIHEFFKPIKFLVIRESMECQIASVLIALERTGNGTSIDAFTSNLIENWFLCRSNQTDRPYDGFALWRQLLSNKPSVLFSPKNINLWRHLLDILTNNSNPMRSFDYRAIWKSLKAITIQHTNNCYLSDRSLSSILNN